MSIETYLFIGFFVGLVGVSFGCSVARIIEKGQLRKEQEKNAVLWHEYHKLKRKYQALKELYEGSDNGN